MLVCSQLALLVACSLASAEPRPSLATSLAEPAYEPVFEARFDPGFDPSPQGTVDPNPPKWFVAVSGNTLQGDFVGPLGSGSDDYTALGFDIGYTNWNQELGVALEGGYLGSTTEIDVGSSLMPTEDVDTQRYLIGLRLLDRGSNWWLPYFRGGFMWRVDSGDTISDDGSGFYVGGGFDFFLGRNLRIGPQLLYTDSQSLDTTEWVLGGVLSFGF